MTQRFGIFQRMKACFGAALIAGCTAVILTPFALSAQPLGSQQTLMTDSTFTYADLASLADAAPLVIRAKIRKQAALEPERSPGLRPGYVRLYIEAETIALLSGSVPVGERLRYLVDLPLSAKGKVPKVKKTEVLLFARPVTAAPGGAAGQLQLVDPSAQLPWSPELDAELRPILIDLVRADSPPRVTGVGDALSVAGNLVGESETQVFLETETGQPASITIVRRPGQTPTWGVSWTEIVDSAASAPPRGTIGWYRLACALPQTLPRGANLARDAAARERASRDYALVMADLGVCARNR